MQEENGCGRHNEMDAELPDDEEVDGTINKFKKS